jgi:hypothetical protein
MTSYVHDFIESELHEREEHTQSLEEAEVPELLWTSDQGERYRPVLLSHHTPEGFVVTGLVIVVENADMRFIHPGAVVAQLSRLAAESGDASPTLVD